jgi:large subunit ribosomal protein L10
LAISKARKDELVAQYGELIGQSKAIFMADYTGMSVKGMEALRHKVREADGAFHVTKKTLLKYALEQADRPVPEELMDGQLAAGFAMDQVPTLAKVLVDFAKSDEKLALKGGIYGNDVLSYDQVKALADLPSLPELRAQLLGLINTPAQNFVSVVASGVRQVVNVIDAYAKSEETAEAA